MMPPAGLFEECRKTGYLEQRTRREGAPMGLSIREGSEMVATLPVPEGWKSVDHPPSLFRRFQFSSYRDTRAFLDRLATLSEETGLYPDLGFGPTHANVTVYGSNGGPPGQAEVDFAARAAALAHPE